MLVWLVAGCSGPADTSAPVESEVEEPSVVAPDPLPAFALGEPIRFGPHEVFGEDAVHTASLEMSDTDRTALLENARSTGRLVKTWFRAELTWDGVPVGVVGIRAKGQSTRKAARGDAVPLKLDIDCFDDALRLHGLKKLNLHASPFDASGLRESLAYGAWREAGVPAPRTGFVRLTVNGTDQGLHTAVEHVGGAFLRHHLPPGDGLLYKPNSPLDARAFQSDWIRRGEDPEGRRFRRLTQTLAQDPVRWGEVVDVDSMIGHFAGDVALGNSDSYVRNQHNYYLYAPTEGPFRWLPWDLDRTWTKTALCPEPVQGKRPPWQAIRADPALEERYRAAVRAFLDGPASPERLSARLDDMASHIDDLPRGRVDQLRALIARNERSLRAQLDSKDCRVR